MQLPGQSLSCELAPGQRLKFEELRARYDAGIGSLREAPDATGGRRARRCESNRGFCVAPERLRLEDITNCGRYREEAWAQFIRLGNGRVGAEIVASLHMLTKLEPDVANTRSRNRELWGKNGTGVSMTAGCCLSSPWLLAIPGKCLFVQSQRYRALSMLQSQKPAAWR